MLMKRTTLMLEEGCMDGLRRLALREGRTLSAVVNEILAEGLRKRRQRAAPERLDLPTFSMGQSRIDLADRDALESAMED